MDQGEKPVNRGRGADLTAPIGKKLENAIFMLLQTHLIYFDSEEKFSGGFSGRGTVGPLICLRH